MTQYIYFTEEEKDRARQTNIAELLCRQGEKLNRSGSEYEWLDGTQKVTVRGNLWYHQYEQTGGDAIDFVKRFYNKSYPEAMEYLLNNSYGQLVVSPPSPKKIKPFALPPRNGNMRRVFAYLVNRRGIDREVLYAFAHKQMVYESKDFHNAVFVGYDVDGIPRHGHKRGTGSESTYKGNESCSLPEFSFHWFGTSGLLYLFEAPIDMLSFICLHKENWRSHSYAASCSVSDRVLFQCLKDNPNIKDIYLCFDNDKPGQDAAKRILDKLFLQGIPSQILVPIHKDWNEDLLFHDQLIERETYQDEMEEEPCPVLQL